MSTATLGVLHTSYPVAMRVAHELLSAQFTVVDAEKNYLGYKIIVLYAIVERYLFNVKPCVPFIGHRQTLHPRSDAKVLDI